MMWKLFVLAACIISVHSEKPVPGRFFSKPLFLRQDFAGAPITEAAQYPPSGWKPSGNRLILPARQEAPAPHTVYGPPSTPSSQPDNEYGAPPEQPEEAPQEPTNEYGAPQEPSNSYGPPQKPQQPDNNYGPPGEPANGYSPPDSQNGGYNYQPPESQFLETGNEYGPPEQPTNAYGPPGTSQEPDPSYGAPSGTGQSPNGYNPPTENGQIPVEQGASERLRQQQFVQQLPNFEQSRFRRPQRQRLHQQNQQRQQPAQPQRLQQLSQRNQVPQQQSLKQQSQFQQQSLPNRAEKQQLYPTPKATNEESGPNVAVATAVSGEYYVIEPNGRLQIVSYTTKNGKLVNGKITGGVRVEDVQSINAPIYRINEFNQLIRIN